MDHSYPKTSLLLERWHNGQREALGQLLMAHGDFVHRKVRELMTPVLRARQETGDYVQEALLEFLESAPRFQIENGKLFRGLLFKIVKNTMLEKERWWRSLRRDIARECPLPEGSVLHLEAMDRTPASIVVAEEQIGFIRLGLEFLDSEDRRVVVMHDFERAKDREIGEAIGKSPDAARMQYNRAVLKLSKIAASLRRGGLASLLAEDAAEEA
jgi:RNA polymerase sigma factor (sigma-70 family)